MKKIISVCLKKSSFNFYKRTLALVLAFIMLFNLSGESFASIFNAMQFKGMLEKESGEIRTALGQIKPEVQGETYQCKSKGDEKERFECAYENFTKVAQDYKEYIGSLSTYVGMSRASVVIGDKTIKEKGEEYNASILAYNKLAEEIVQRYSYSKNASKLAEYHTWRIIKAQEEAINLQEEAALAILKESDPRYDIIKQNNLETKKKLKAGSAKWQGYEKVLKAIMAELEGKEAVIEEKKGIYEEAVKAKQAEIGEARAEYERQTKALFGLDENSSEGEWQYHINKLVERYAAWQAEYEEAKKKYEAKLAKETSDKAKKFTEAVKGLVANECKQEYARIAELNVPSGDSWKDWGKVREAFSAEKEMHRKCFGAPALGLGDFVGDKYGFSYDEYEEIKYKEYKEKYIKSEQKYVVTEEDGS